ncbi:oxygen-dependent coproporphyrinogen-III oxidase [Gemmatimonadetes bacterium T265]|nr:oxygen-dependent coproporphyrinogen-III oxidase [Gemmatimonadetes bacterium T265]
MHLTATIPTPASARRAPYTRPPADAADDRARAGAWTVAVHDEITRLLTELDRGGRFAEERWERAGGGGGVSRLLADGATFEKAGVNRSTVFGALPDEVRRMLVSTSAGGRASAGGAGPLDFFATGVSVVVHPRSPMVPTVHLNVRYFELADAAGERVDAWFGGGTDLTPTYPRPADARHFHAALAAACAPFGPAVYARGKACCDDYFANAHRGGERRGVGGIFYDHVRPGEGVAEHLNTAALHGLSAAVGTVLAAAYAPVVERRRDEPYGDAERALQLERRGRYAEFNLLHDRGTLFGLRTHARVDSVLMSLPPMAAWGASGAHAPGSAGARLAAMLAPRDWLAAGAGDDVLGTEVLA